MSLRSSIFGVHARPQGNAGRRICMRLFRLRHATVRGRYTLESLIECMIEYHSKRTESMQAT